MASSASSRLETVNADILVLTYGAIVSQLVEDLKTPAEVNSQLMHMGYNIGIRIIDEFCAKSRATPRCKSFKEAMETLAKDGFRMFVGVSAALHSWNDNHSACTLRLTENPLADFVELPEHLKDLRYNNILCGVISGALEQVSLKVECSFISDIVNGDKTTDIRVALKDVISETAGLQYESD